MIKRLFTCSGSGLTISLLLIPFIAGCLQVQQSGRWVPFSSSLKAGAQCIVDISALHPTQFAIGYWEIDRRAEKVKTKSAKKLEKYLEEHTGKIVVGPGGEPYIIDRHHLAFLMQRTGMSKTIPAIVEANLKNMSIDAFWKEMAARKWVYLYDGHGKGPLAPRQLPARVKDLADDPFRSLAWAVRERGGYHKTEDPFAEFTWANFFRARFTIDSTDSNIERIIPEALKLCHSPSAHELPGYFIDPGK